MASSITWDHLLSPDQSFALGLSDYKKMLMSEPSAYQRDRMSFQASLNVDIIQGTGSVKAITGRCKMIIVIYRIHNLFLLIFATIIDIKDESVRQFWASQDSSQYSLHVFPANMLQSHGHELLAVFTTCHISNTCSLITNTCYLST